MQTVKVFVYGTLKQGFRAHHMLEPEGKLLGATKVPGVLISCGHYPGLVPDRLCEVHGEVWEIPETKVTGLDFYEGVARGLFTRHTIPGPFGEMYYYQYETKMGTNLNDYVLVAKEGVWRNSEYPKVAGSVATCWTYKEEKKYWAEIKGESAEGLVILNNKGAQGVVPPWEGRVQRSIERQMGLPTPPGPNQGDVCSLPEPEPGPLVLPKLGTV
jgi:gamma-glutamylcyclotransferase (GGCT)/AIG2-like uncharacterized protein YtfP